MKNKKIASILLAGTILASSTPVYTFAEIANVTTPNTAENKESVLFALQFLEPSESVTLKEDLKLKVSLELKNNKITDGNIDNSPIADTDIKVKFVGKEVADDKKDVVDNEITIKTDDKGIATGEHVVKLSELKEGKKLNIQEEYDGKILNKEVTIIAKTKEIKVNDLYEGSKLINGTTGPNAEIEVKDSIDNSLKTGTIKSDDTGKFNVALNRKLVKNEKIKVISKEENKNSVEEDYMVKSEEFTLKLENGATAKVNGVTISSGSKVDKGSKVIISASSRTGYNFKDWTATGVTVADKNSNVTNFTMPDGDVTITANYTAKPVETNEYELRFDSYVERAEVNDKRVYNRDKIKKGEKVYITAEDRKNYEFDKWDYTSDAYVTIYNSKDRKDAYFYMPSEKVTITTKYTKNEEKDGLKKVYPTKKYKDDRYVEGRLDKYKNTKVYVYYDGREIGSGDTDRDGDYKIRVNKSYTNSQFDDFVYYVDEDNKTKDDLVQVYPKDVELYSKSNGEYRDIKGTLKDEKNRKVYVYLNGNEKGNGSTNSDGKFDFRLSKYIDDKYDEKDVKFYVKKELKQVYPKDVELYSKSNGEYRDIKGTLKDYKNEKIYVYLNGNEKGNGSTNSDGKFDFRLSKYIDDKYDEKDVKFYVKKELKQVYPKDVELYSKSNGEYRDIKGTLKDYKNEKIYVYLNGNEKGNGSTNSDGKFDFRLSNYIDDKYDEDDLKFYIKDETKKDSKKPIVTRGIAKETKLEGRDAGKDASIEVKDSSGNKLGSTTADKDGKFTVSLNRELRGTEIITLIAKESDKNEVKVDYTVPNVVNESTNAYIKGYSDGSFKPNGNMTRAEATVMMARLVNGSDNFTTPSVTKFKDANNAWYSKEINYAIEKGLVDGYPDGTFKPDNTITRAEFAQMIANYSAGKSSRLANFSDITGHWAYGAINKVYGQNVINGYPDGSFKPDRKITRAESVKMLNIVFEKQSSTKTNTFNDVKPSDWFYNDVMKAAN